MKTLVVVYSRTGTTLSLAKGIADALAADLEVIEDRVNRRGLLGFLRSGYEALRKKLPPIADPKHDPEDYDLVVVGTPIWAGRMSSPVRAYLHRFRGKLRKAAFFATSAGGGHQNALAEMAQVADVEPIPTLELAADQLKRGNAAEAVDEFIARLSRPAGAR
ncbi:NAD(P)H-dependent oxidoreductase [Candidatus Bipolaricaulota bacterium]|nr:NAD(P)H-dependent oxidoreductase [Candidatus Bipolaricaulota bacterium]